MMKVATVASIIVVLTLCLVVSVSALGLRKVGQFKVSHPSFMHILPVTGPESKDLVISSFTGNPFGSGKLYIEADISSSYKNTSTINPTMIKGTDTFKWPNDFKMAPKGVFPSSDSALVQVTFTCIYFEHATMRVVHHAEPRRLRSFAAPSIGFTKGLYKACSNFCMDGWMGGWVRVWVDGCVRSRHQILNLFY